MPAVSDFAAPSTLSDLIAHVKQAFGAMANPTPIMIGAQYLDRGVGSPPRIVFVPEDGIGKVGSPTEMGYAASVSHFCNVLVRASDTAEVRGDPDNDRTRGATTLADLVIVAVQTAGMGRITWGNWQGDNPTKVDTGAGAGIAFSFTYTRNLRHNLALWSLPTPTPDTSAAPAVPPPGIPATTVDITFDVEPT